MSSYGPTGYIPSPLIVMWDMWWWAMYHEALLRLGELTLVHWSLNWWQISGVKGEEKYNSRVKGPKRRS
jgi:hypothetical protein